MDNDGHEIPGHVEHGQRGRWFFVGVAILACGVGGFIGLMSLRSAPEAAPRVAQAPLVRTLPVVLESGHVPVTGSGIVEPRAAVTLSSQVAGEVSEISPNLIGGGTFAHGEQLLVVDDRQYRARLERARAARRATAAQLGYARKQIERARPLVEKGTLQPDELDRLLSEQQRLTANLSAQAAEIAQAELDLEHTRIHAPFPGGVTSENVDIGQYVMPGQELARIYASDEVEIAVQLDDSAAGLIPGLWELPAGNRPRASVRTEFGDYTYAWPGYAHRAETTIDRKSRTVNVIVRVPNPGDPGALIDGGSERRGEMTAPPPLLIGSYVTVTIEGINLKRFFRLPRAALREDDKVWIVDEEQRLAVEPIYVVFARDDELTVVADSVGPSTPVIVSKLSVMTDGMPVKVLSSGDEATREMPAP